MSLWLDLLGTEIRYVTTRNFGTVSALPLPASATRMATWATACPASPSGSFADENIRALGFTDDDIYYGGNGRPLAAVPTKDRHVATSYEAQANWQVNRNLNLNVFLSHIEAGSALEAAGGESGQYYGVWAQYRF